MIYFFGIMSSFDEFNTRLFLFCIMGWEEKVMERDKTIFLFNELIGNIKNTTREVCYYFFDSND